MTESDRNASLYRALRRLDEENADLRRKLAHHEFRQLERELTSDDPFALNVLATGDPAPVLMTPRGIGDAPLPRLPVPMGSVIDAASDADLPVFAVHDDGLTSSKLAAALMGVLRAQFRAPFARLVFLCSGFEAVALLGRYGFVSEVIGSRPPGSELVRLHLRYGVTEIRSLATGAVIAARPED